MFLQEEQKGGAIDRILDKGVLRVGDQRSVGAFRVFPNETSGNYEGIDIGVVQYIADSLGGRIGDRPLDFEALWGAVATGQIDMSHLFDYHTGREEADR
ncbi:MAG: hypothetical protein MZV70_44630 [Desulfobacterales bacterium]|nr:hypothetical protein [Desulfobacterales bacterium]